MSSGLIRLIFDNSTKTLATITFDVSAKTIDVTVVQDRNHLLNFIREPESLPAPIFEMYTIVSPQDQESEIRLAPEPPAIYQLPLFLRTLFQNNEQRR